VVDSLRQSPAAGGIVTQFGEGVIQFVVQAFKAAAYSSTNGQRREDEILAGAIDQLLRVRVPGLEREGDGGLVRSSFSERGKALFVQPSERLRE